MNAPSGDAPSLHRPHPAGFAARAGVGTRYPTKMREVVRVEKDRGCTVEHTEDGRVAVRQPGHDSARYTMASTPSGHHSLMNAIEGVEHDQE